MIHRHSPVRAHFCPKNLWNRCILSLPPLYHYLFSFCYCPAKIHYPVMNWGLLCQISNNPHLAKSNGQVSTMHFIWTFCLNYWSPSSPTPVLKPFTRLLGHHPFFFFPVSLKVSILWVGFLPFLNLKSLLYIPTYSMSSFNCIALKSNGS